MKRNKHSSSISIDEYFRKLSRVEYVNAVAQPASTSDSGSATQPTPMESSQSTGKYNLQLPRQPRAPQKFQQNTVHQF